MDLERRAARGVMLGRVTLILDDNSLAMRRDDVRVESLLESAVEYLICEKAKVVAVNEIVWERPKKGRK